MYMYEENLLPFSHVQTFEQNVHVQAFEAKIVCCTTTTITTLTCSFIQPCESGIKIFHCPMFLTQ